MPLVLEFVLFLPKIVLPFVYWLRHSMTWVDHLVLVHLLIVVALSMIAVSKTGTLQENGRSLSGTTLSFTTESKISFE